MNKFFDIVDLNGAWTFYEASAKEKEYEVTVPGSVLSCLLDNNLIEDPFKGMNEYSVREKLRADYTFKRKFIFDKDLKLDWNLTMEGLDTVADIYINNKKVIRTENMHRVYSVNINKFLIQGENEIRVEFKSPITYIEAHVPKKNKEIHYRACGAMKGNQYIRKAHSMFGWDWGPQLPDMGIYRNIYLKGYERVSLDYIKVTQEHTENAVYITVKGDASTAKEKALKVGYGTNNSKYGLLISVYDPEGNEIVSEEASDIKIKIEKPKLWWVNRLGAQPLYTVKARLINFKNPDFKGNEITEKIGLREFLVSREKDEWGEEFAFMINGVKFFSKGADYIPEDCIYSRITKERIKYLIDSCKEAGFNTLRVWGGGYYPGDDFYSLCDEAGIIVWQDFAYACNVYELTKEFKENIEKEAIDNVRRLRNHASLGLWCGNNEMESAWDHWGGFCDHSKALRNDYLQMFEEMLPKIVEKEDGNHFYWPSSPSSTGGFNRPDADEIGDRHYWDVWHGEKPFTDYENYYFRFCSEFGFQSFPEMATIKTFAKEGDFNIFSPVMESHQKNDNANAKILHYISENFLYPKDFESLLYISQVLQGMAVKYGVEHWRRSRGRCMGSLYWQLNDNWPVASWSSIDYYGRWKALHYMAKDFYSDILGSLKRDGFVFTPYVQNETLKEAESDVKIFVKTMDNEVVFASGQTLKCAGMSVCKGEEVDITSAVRHRENTTYIEAVFTNSDGTVIKQIEPMLKYKQMNLPKAVVNITLEQTDPFHIKAILNSNKFTAFTALMCEDKNLIWDKNYFFITGKENVEITGRLADGKEIAVLPEVRVMTLDKSYTK